MEEIYFVQGADGKVWNDTLSFSSEDCKVKFANMWHPQISIDRSTAWNIWSRYEKIGYVIKSLDISGSYVDKCLQQLEMIAKEIYRINFGDDNIESFYNDWLDYENGRTGNINAWKAYESAKSSYEIALNLSSIEDLLEEAHGVS